MKHKMAMTKRDFENVPMLKDKDTPFDSLVIIPSGDTDDSGYMIMNFVAIVDKFPIGRFQSCDMVEIGGVGGYGSKWKDVVPDLIPPVRWRIHCLPLSGLIEIYADDKKELTVSDAFGLKLYSNKA